MTVSAISSALDLLELGSATLGESGGLTMAPRIKPAWRGARVAAPAFTVECTPGDNLGIHVAVTRAPQGSVLVASVGELPDRGYWGEVLTTGAEARGLTGLVIDGGVRDTAALESHGFPVFSSLVALPGATKCHKGKIGVRVVVGGVAVETGDWIVGDSDGVTVIPGDQLDDVMEAGRARLIKEQGLFSSLLEGSTTVELLNLDATLIESL